ncbi:MAG: hypothetical protein EHM47_15745 [Ignavibacteriales bacterium]|nr:MAG: hypothetical protein EHM47_15745 [Ignavibacteriales bacterium]
MKKIFLFLLIIYSFNVPVNSQDYNYWVNAQPGTTKIFTISFTDWLNGKAVSEEGDVLLTSDGGESWNLEINNTEIPNDPVNELIWQADIYCSVMQTTDSGNFWYPYDSIKQEHFCEVYLKDKNTGYNVASEFLNKVTEKILFFYKNNNVTSLERPQLCTEYYSNPSVGWAVGWCLKNFNMNRNLVKTE